MATNTLNTRIKLKYDTLSNWLGATTFIPLEGEVCIAVIPNGDASQPKKVYDPTRYPNNDNTNNLSGLSPYAIGIKVGDGVNNFANLPWIQAIAGDVYGWAKAAERPGANNIYVSYNNGSSTIQQAISGIESSLGNIVTQGVDAATLGQALADLQSQLNGQSTEIFNSNPLSNDNPPVATYPTQIIRTLTQNGLSVTATSSALVEDDLPSIHLSKITDLEFNTTYNQLTNKAATMADISNYVNDRIVKSMTFIGVSSTEIAEGIVENKTYPTINNTIVANLSVGDVVLYRVTKTVGEDTVTSDLEFVWTGDTSGWELIGDEGSYAIRGNIKKSDLVQALQTEIDGKLDASTASNTYVAKNGTDSLMTQQEHTKLSGIEVGAEVNVLEGITVNGTAATINNKIASIDIPLIGIQQHSKYNSIDTTTDATITSRKITLDEIAFNGEVRNLKQTDNTYLVFNCGNASDELFA